MDRAPFYRNPPGLLDKITDDQGLDMTARRVSDTDRRLLADQAVRTSNQMKPPRSRVAAMLLVPLAWLPPAAMAADSPPTSAIDQNNIVWNSPAADSCASMPVGNGDVALNVWVEKNDDLVFYISKTDAFSENGVIQKLGRVRVKLAPNPFKAGGPFRQELRLHEGEIVIQGGADDARVEMRVWVDANRPVIHLDATGKTAFTAEAALELWRTEARTVDKNSPEFGEFYELSGSPKPVVIASDTVPTGQKNRVVWFHRNPSSIFPDVLENQHLAMLAGKFSDPLLHRTYGGCMQGPGFESVNDRTLRAVKPSTEAHLEIHVLTAQTATEKEWSRALDQQIARSRDVEPAVALREHREWWARFWDRSRIEVSGSKDAEIVTQGYLLQRWMTACAGRGALPMKFNGSLFTVDARLRDRTTKALVPLDADYRGWGSSFWFQNTRLLYWPLVASGDFDLMDAWFRMFLNALPLAKARTAIYYKHDGVFFNETISFWGLPNNNNFGWGNPGTETRNPFIRRYWQGGIELIAVMLDRYDCTRDESFARGILVPLAGPITTFFDLHWPRDAHGKIRFDPAQSLETWQTSVNPLPEIAGLRFVLPRLLALPESLTTPELRSMWKKMLADLPPVPVANTPEGKPALRPAEIFSNRRNMENTELYALFPYRLYGIGRPGIDAARNAYDIRLFKRRGCWSQEGMHAAALGDVENAKGSVVANFKARDGAQRFPAFWGHSFDWTPDMDNGGSGMITLQMMLLQTDGRRILLLPAWPMDWDADFKLHAPLQTVVEGRVHAGKITFLKVTPAERRKDVEILPPPNHHLKP